LTVYSRGVCFTLLLESTVVVTVIVRKKKVAVLYDFLQRLCVGKISIFWREMMMSFTSQNSLKRHSSSSLSYSM
jgi:hypothetical protein